VGGRTAALVGAVVSVAALGALSGAGAGLLTQKEPHAAGTPAPLSAIPPQVSSPPSLSVRSDPAYPPAFEKPAKWNWVEVPGTPNTLRVQIPRAWTDHILLAGGENQARFRIVREYNLRVAARPDMTSIAEAGKEREAELRRNGTPGLANVSRASGTVTSKVDDTTRWYEELAYSYVDTDHYRKWVRIRWVDGMELAVTGRFRDVEALKVVLKRATETANLQQTESDKPS
jgi:hypothetical protein